MKYPEHTVTKPLTGSAATMVVKAVKEGRVIANAQAKSTATRIAKQYVQSQKAAKK